MTVLKYHVQKLMHVAIGGNRVRHHDDMPAHVGQAEAELV